MKIVDPACLTILFVCVGLFVGKFLKSHDNFTRIGLRNVLHAFTLNTKNENGLTVCTDPAEQKTKEGMCL